MSKVSNVVKNMGAGTWVRVSTILFKLVQVPLLLAYLDIEDYGRWLILYSLPSWLAYASQGFGSVASNEIPICVASGRHEEAQQVYSTSFAFMLVLAVGGVLLIGLIVPWVSWADFLDVAAGRRREIILAVFALGLATFASFLGELFYGRFRAAERSHQAILITSFQPWIELVVLFVILQYSTKLSWLACGVLGAMLVYLLIYGVLSRRAYPRLVFRAGLIRVAAFRDLLKKGFAFQAFPLGNALLFQGNLLAVQLILGPSAVALFGTVRTLVRVLNQALEVVSKSIWPELSFLFGKDDMGGVRRLHRMGVGLCLGLSIGGGIGLALLGPFLYELWVGDSIRLSRDLLLLFLLPIPFNALWLTSSTVMMASNQHGGLAKRYIVATALAAIGCAILTYFLGIHGAAFSTLIADLILIPYVIRQALALSRDDLDRFVAGVVSESKSVLTSGWLSLRSTIKA